MTFSEDVGTEFSKNYTENNNNVLKSAFSVMKTISLKGQRDNLNQISFVFAVSFSTIC